jgi:hypothetical protein
MKSRNKIKAGLRGSDHSTAAASPLKLKLTSAAVLLGMFVMTTHSTIASAAVNIPIGGEVERIIVDNPTDTWSRGTMVVGGVNVIIPANMVIDLPANRMTLQQFFVNAPSACAADVSPADGIPDQTGLAKADSCNSSFTGAAVTILANRTNNGDIVAGDVFLEKATELVSGIVTFINYNDGYFRVDGIPGDDTTGAMVRVNDPEGRFTHQTGLGCAGSGTNCSADTRYGVDPDNYTFTASTGYPMCIPSTVARTYDFDVDKSTVIEPAETGLIAQDNGTGTTDALCPAGNRSVNPVGDSRLFAPIQVGDHVNAEGNFENIGGVTFLSAHTVGVSVGLTTAADAFSPDYMIFDEVGWDIPGFQNQRVRDLLIAFGTLGTTHMDVFGLYYDPLSNAVEELVFATTFGCDAAAGPGSCTNQGVVGNTAVFKIVHDVDFINGVPIDPGQSPCAHLNAAYANGGIPDVNGNFVTVDPTGRCTGTITLADEFEVLSPPSRDLIGRTRQKHALDPSVVTLDFHGLPSQNGEYLNPVGLGHPEFVEINLNALQTPLIFSGAPWNLDRRLGPGGGCDGEASCDVITAIGDPSMSLNPFPFSDLDPGTQNGPDGAVGATPRVLPHTTQRGRTLSHWPLTGGVEMAWPPADPVAQGITATLHAGLTCSVLSGVDTDGDLVDDAIDNCTLVGNADQRDTNGDGFGNVCDADLNGDNLTDLDDFSQFRIAFSTNDPDADFDGSGSVNLSDFSTFRLLFGSAPGPSGLNP